VLALCLDKQRNTMRLISPKLYAGVRLVTACAILVTIAYQLHYSLVHYHVSGVNFFSYFTILSNLIFAAALVAGAFCTWMSKGRCWPLEYVRGGAVIYMVTTGIVYGLLLSGSEAGNHVTTPTVNFILHQIIPLFATIDWVFVPPRIGLRRSITWTWLVFPVTYVAYTLLRGPHAHWYPYPFFNPDQPGGYWRVATYSVGIAAGMIGCILLVGWSRVASNGPVQPKKLRR
jgi:hypothetical protein